MNPAPSSSSPPAAGGTVPAAHAGLETSVALLLKARQGDDDALNRLLERYRAHLAHWAAGRLPAWARGSVDTQDIVSHALQRLARVAPRFVPKHDTAFQAYARRAVLDSVRDAIRAAKRRPGGAPLHDHHRSSEPSPLEAAIGRELLDRYDAALERLRPSDRDAIVGRVEWGLRWPELAETLGKSSAAAAQMTVTRALVRLAKEMAVDRPVSRRR